MNNTGAGNPDRRRYARVHGPFDGWRIGPDRRHVPIINLGLGGCFIKETRKPGDAETFVLQIDLDEDGVIEVFAAALYHRADGTAVTFLNLTQPTLEAIRRKVGRAMS